ncbi:MAG: hypothetical protein JWR24_1003, partial [Actinoallomurus sp.]|nr:hypothetical protein [Actinoallomurus sp.]
MSGCLIRQRPDISAHGAKVSVLW